MERQEDDALSFFYPFLESRRLLSPLSPCLRLLRRCASAATWVTTCLSYEGPPIAGKAGGGEERAEYERSEHAGEDENEDEDEARRQSTRTEDGGPEERKTQARVYGLAGSFEFRAVPLALAPVAWTRLLEPLMNSDCTTNKTLAKQDVRNKTRKRLAVAGATEPKTSHGGNVMKLSLVSMSELLNFACPVPLR